jgi:hypothetical protein
MQEGTLARTNLHINASTSDSVKCGASPEVRRALHLTQYGLLPPRTASPAPTRCASTALFISDGSDRCMAVACSTVGVASPASYHITRIINHLAVHIVALIVLDHARKNLKRQSQVVRRALLACKRVDLWLSGARASAQAATARQLERKPARLA